MSYQRLTLSSPLLAARIKKYDTYEMHSRSIRRAVKNGNEQSKKIDQTRVSDLSSGWHTYSPTVKLVNNDLRATNIVDEAEKSKNSTQKLALEVVRKAPARSYESTNFALEKQHVQKNNRLSSKFFYSVGMAVFLFSLSVSAHTLVTNLNAKKQLGVLGAQSQSLDEQGVAEGTGSDPAEASISAASIAAYKVDPELPRYLRIPDIGVFARIKHTGVDKSGAVDSPANINDVSWFKESAPPGNPVGSSLLLGHVSGWTAPGVFKNLNKLKPGQIFEIEKGSGEKLRYEVTRGEQIPLDQLIMSNILSSEVSGAADLKLMTCSGKYNKQTDSYEDRYVVYAKLLK